MTSIPDRALVGCSQVKRVIIPSTVTRIQDCAFYRCTGLTNVNEMLREGITSIGASAFESCTQLTQITLPESLKTIGNRAFVSCTGLTEVTIPKGVTTIGSGDGAFGGCNNLELVTFEEGMTSIPDRALVGCSQVKRVIIPSTVTRIRDCAFYQCTGLISMTYNSTIYTKISELKSALTTAGVTYVSNSFTNVSLSGD